MLSKLVIALIMTIGVGLDTPVNNSDSNFKEKLQFLSDYISIRYPKHNFDNYLYVEVKQQKMHLIKDGKLLKSYVVSTAKNGLGNVQHTECTPSGLLKIQSKTGSRVPLGGIIKGPNYTGRKCEIYKDETISKEDLVTTRAIRLTGLEEGKNKGGKVDTFSRYIYIHGTPEEGRLGQAVSHGCIRMKNSDIIELFDLIDTSTKVLILNI